MLIECDIYYKDKTMHFPHILLFISVFRLALAELEENKNVMQYVAFGPLEQQYSPKNVSIAPQVTDFTDILAISNAIRNFQNILIEDDKYLPNMQAYLTASTDGNNGKEFKLSTFLSSVYDEIVNNHVNITQPSINEPLTVTAANNSRIVNCNTLVHLNQTEISVEVVNSSRLGYVLKYDPEVTNRHKSGVCSLVLFYAESCQFSTLAAPHFNVLPRIFPQIKMVAFNAISEQRYNTMYGITGVPSLVLFHNGKPIAKYNGSDYSLYEFTKFVIRHTDLTPNEKVEISMTDFLKPIPGYGNPDYDFSLWLAWFVIILWTLVYVRTMHFWRKFVEDIKNIWREAEAQHEHAD